GRAHVGGRHLPVGGDGGHAGGAARGEAARRPHARSRERGGVDHRAGGGWRHLSPRRAGDRRRVDQGVHEPDRRTRGVDAQDGATAVALHFAGPGSVRALAKLPELVERVLAKASEVERIAERMMRAANVLYLGRGYNFPVALEGALKLKEISYIHAEGYPAAEMKHGPIALIDDLMPVVFI